MADGTANQPGGLHGSGLKAFALVVVLILGLSWIRLSPSGSQRGSTGKGDATSEGEIASGRDEPGALADAQDEVASRTGGGNRSLAGGTSAGGRSGTSRGGALECKAGRNGGATDTGVTGTKIRLATTAVQDGPAKSLLEPSIAGLRAVLNKANGQGGVCGRLLDLTIKNDSFRADLGQQYIRNFIAEGYFALPVVPSAEGLGAAIDSGDIQRAGIPVVGTDGMRKEQYEASGNATWVWPVATATVSTMRIMAKYGYATKGARTFAIVWDNKYKFGIEGRDAFKEQVSALGGDLLADQPLDPDQAGYNSEVANFNDKCGGSKCDMVALLLLPDTAHKWVSPRPAMGAKVTSGAQTLFTDTFARACIREVGSLCHGIVVWTGYNPPIEQYAGIPDVSRYVDEVTSTSPGVDVRNQFLEGSYLGMTLFVEALKKVGPNLTRSGLRQALDSMDYGNQITSGLSWRPGKHFANTRARAFSIVEGGGDFRGWRDEQTNWVVDPVFGG